MNEFEKYLELKKEITDLDTSNMTASVFNANMDTLRIKVNYCNFEDKLKEDLQTSLQVPYNKFMAIDEGTDELDVLRNIFYGEDNSIDIDALFECSLSSFMRAREFVQRIVDKYTDNFILELIYTKASTQVNRSNLEECKLMVRELLINGLINETDYDELCHMLEGQVYGGQK